MKDQIITFPKICADLGGAEYVRYGSTYAKIKLPGVEREVRRALTKLPARESWTSFNLADAAK